MRVATALDLVSHHIARCESRLRVDAVETKLGVGSDVIVCKLAEVGIIDTDNLCLFGCSESESRDKVHDPTENSGHDERVGESGDSIGDLVTKLNVVVVKPSTWNLGDAVEPSNGCLREQCSHDAADDTANSVRCEHVEGLVDADEELDLGSKVTPDTSDETDRDGGRGTDVSGSGGDTDKTRDRTRAKTDGGELSLESPVEQHPGDTTDRSSEVGNDTSLDGAEVGGKSGSTVETKPAEPEEDGAKDDKGSVVGLVCETLGAVASSFTEVDGDGEGSGTRGNVNGGSTSEIETTHVEDPSLRVPCPACDRAVDDGQPAEEEDHDGADFGSFGETTNGEDTSDELLLVGVRS